MDKNITIDIVKIRNQQVHNVDSESYHITFGGLFNVFYQMFKSRFAPINLDITERKKETLTLDFNNIYDCIYEQLLELIEHDVTPSMLIIGEGFLDVDGDYEVVTRETLMKLQTYVSTKSGMAKIDTNLQVKITPHLNGVLLV